MSLDTTDFAEQVAALEQSLGASAQVAAGFDAAMAQMRDGIAATGREVASLTAGLGTGLRGAFDALVFDGASLGDTLTRLAERMASTVYAVAMKPVQGAVGGALSQGLEALLGAGGMFAQGAAFSRGRVMPFATGGVVSGPTAFPMAGGTGLMGEAGPEAILPLARGADGRLGVQSRGGPAVTVVMNISTPDVQGFRQSQSQIAAQMNRVLAQGRRNA